jgi:GxxExxY protein
MNADERRYAQIDEITEKVIGAAYKVSNTSGTGFLEKVYEKALAYELRKAGLKVEQQRSIDVYYDGIIVGLYIADLFVEDILPVELKAAKALDDVHFAQSLNYLRASQSTIGLVINFGTPRVQVKRIVNNHEESPNAIR